MKEKINALQKEIKNYSGSGAEGIEAFRMKYISKKSVINDLFEDFKKLSIEEKKEFGKTLNELKNLAKEKLLSLSKESSKNDSTDNNIDYSLPAEDDTVGSLHPLRIVRNNIIKIFRDIGFSIEDGPEIEEDWYNFTALNFPENHPAREMQDTFFISKDPDVVLRTHTSNVQIRLMEKQKPPMRVIIPGRVYRNETVSAKSHCFFHQVEGLYIDKNVSFKDLKDTLYYFAKEMFGSDTKVRFRPSYFPFTEPSAEMDISWKNGWLEILGSGLVDPNVLKNCGIDPKEYSGFAFGMGIERIAMLKYGIDDLRLFSENDKRFLKQFRGVH
ncbi:MAG: phenylalanine--tRNA ligase subunit alpha [Bacteroidota bacterium]|jgi:phenylalanyl-tRNA synthetase alpha chain|nr:phenylalanine--tRNA ligase subunit alpha [Bacteroidota bacterium]MEC8702513.1 phenylalanine--tRNA ligase subunit alpha [Bacteroidota bacterium]|tara:strand:- start:685 stop:1668 length:984 start_codon:yes stop_codon:yes gene_type:complete